MEGNRERRPSSSPNRSPLSPFPFGSPITFSDRSLLSPLRRVSGDTLVPSQRSSSLSSSQSQHVFRGKVRAQEVYGGPLLFGGTSSLRRNRLLSSSPYDSPALHRFNRFSKDAKSNTSSTSTPSTSKSTTPVSEDGMSSSVRSILETLERMSTPVRDAQKIPFIPRAEKRRQVMLELDSGLAQAGQGPNFKRRRPNLSSKVGTSPATRALLNGPPLRTLRSPVSATVNPSTALTSARINFTSMQNKSLIQSEVSPMIGSSVGDSSNISNGAVLSFPSKLSSAVSDTSSSLQTAERSLTDPVSRPFSHPPLETSNFHPTLPEASKEKSSSDLIKSKDSNDVTISQTSISTSQANKWNTNFEAGFFKNLLTSNSQNPTSDERILSPTNSNTRSEKLTSSLSSGSSRTTDTLILSPTRKTFSFSNPIPVTQLSVELMSTQESKKFTFCNPHTVPGVNNNELGIVSKTSQNSLTQMPDLTSGPAFSAKSQKSPFQPTAALKEGSVLDILGGNHKLPDVTGVTNSNSVKSIGTSAWISTEKFGSKSWT